MLIMCGFRQSGQCTLAASLSSQPLATCEVDKFACLRCQRDNPSPDNPTRRVVITAIMAAAAAGDTARAEKLRAMIYSPTVEVYAPAPQHGPGTELKALLASLGLTASGCGCDRYAAQMDVWGVDGCQQRRADIVEHLREQRDKAGWGAVLTAAGRAAAQGLRVDILDPLGWLVDEAMKRAG